MKNQIRWEEHMNLIIRVAALALAVLTFVPHSYAQETIKLTIAAGHPPIFLWVKEIDEALIPAVDAELARTGKYKNEWNRAYGGTLAKVGQELDAIRDGIADLGTAFSLFSPDKLPLQNISYLAPFHTSDPEVVVNAIHELQNEIPKMGAQWARYNQVYLGGGFPPDAYHLWTKFPINSVTDLNGHKIGTPGATANWIKGTGAVAVASDLTRYYNSIQTGVFEGVIVFATAALPAKLHEVAPYITKVNYGSTYAGGITFNKERWDALPEEVRAAFKTAIKAYEKAYFTEIKKRSSRAFEVLTEAGAKIREVPEEERKQFADMLPNIAKSWASDLDAKGLPGTEVLKGFMNKMRERGMVARDWDKE
jgi:TRAP-type C4-dicarboxylate transport system substrate-binding protein